MQILGAALLGWAAHSLLVQNRWKGATLVVNGETATVIPRKVLTTNAQASRGIYFDLANGDVQEGATYFSNNGVKL